MNERRKRNSSRVNLTISVVFHSVLVLAAFFLAAREGMLGKRLATLVATIEKKTPETPKPKEQPKLEPLKPVEQTKALAAAPPPAARAINTAPAATVEAPPMAAPPSVDVPFFSGEGAKEVVEVSDPKQMYKGLVELALRTRWNRPEGIEDDTYVAEVELNIDVQGNVTGTRWIRVSGDARWDKSVKTAVAATKAISRPPPKGFPGTFVARFDIEMTKSEEVMKVSSLQ